MFTYRCGYLEWSSPTTIGLNAPPDYYYNHPLSGTGVSPDEIACVHLESEWNNVVIDMEPNPVILPITPTPTSFTGTPSPAFSVPMSIALWLYFGCYYILHKYLNSTQGVVLMLATLTAVQLTVFPPTASVTISALYSTIAAMTTPTSAKTQTVSLRYSFL